MKTLTFLFTFLIGVSANAQWYQSYGVTDVNELSKQQCDLALQKAQKTAMIGEELTIGGGFLSAVGLATFLIVANEASKATTWKEVDIVSKKSTAGTIFLISGSLCLSVGVPLWISGSFKKTQIEMTMIRYKNQAYIPAVGLKINF